MTLRMRPRRLSASADAPTSATVRGQSKAPRSGMRSVPRERLGAKHAGQARQARRGRLSWQTARPSGSGLARSRHRASDIAATEGDEQERLGPGFAYGEVRA